MKEAVASFLSELLIDGDRLFLERSSPNQIPLFLRGDPHHVQDRRKERALLLFGSRIGVACLEMPEGFLISLLGQTGTAQSETAVRDDPPVPPLETDPP